MSWALRAVTASSVPAALLVLFFAFLTDVDIRRIDMRQFVDWLSAVRSPVEVELNATDWLRLRQCLTYSRGTEGSGSQAEWSESRDPPHAFLTHPRSRSCCCCC